jgi:hypothetical protein
LIEIGCIYNIQGAVIVTDLVLSSVFRCLNICTMSIAPPTDLAVDPSFLNGDGVCTSVRPRITGKGVAGYTVTLRDYSLDIGSGIVAGNGTWSIIAFIPVYSSHFINATQEDGSGNVSGINDPPLTFDTVDPTLPTLPAPVVDPASLDVNGALATPTPTFSGTGGIAGNTLVLTDFGVPVGTSTIASDGTWSLTCTINEYNRSAHSFAAIQANSAGQVSGMSPNVQTAAAGAAPVGPVGPAPGPTITANITNLASQPSSAVSLTAIVRFVDAAVQPLFGQTYFDTSAVSLTPVQQGTHVVTVMCGDATTGILTDVTESFTFSFDDLVAMDGTAACGMKDFTGASYCSLNAFGATQPVYLSSSRTNTMFAFTRGTWPNSMLTVSLVNFASGPPTTWTVTMQSTSFVATAPTVIPSAGNLVRIGEDVTNMAQGAGTWPGKVRIDRALTTLVQGDASVYTSPFAQLQPGYNNGFSLKPGTYCIKWKVPGYGVDSFVSFLRRVPVTGASFAGVITPASQPATMSPGIYLGDVAYSPSAASSSLAHSCGRVIVTIDSTGASSDRGAVFALSAIAETTAVVNGQGLVLSDNLFQASGFNVKQDRLSQITIERLQ